MSYVGKIVKSTLLLAAVGVALGFAAPALASFAVTLGLAPATAAALSVTHPIWAGVFFGAFGAINAALSPVFDGIFGMGSNHHSISHSTSKAAPVIVMGHAPTVSADVAPELATTHFQDKLAVERAAPQEHTI